MGGTRAAINLHQAEKRSLTVIPTFRHNLALGLLDSVLRCPPPCTIARRFRLSVLFTPYAVDVVEEGVDELQAGYEEAVGRV